MMRLFSLSSVLLILSSCVSVEYSKLEKFPAAKKDSALIVFYREDRLKGSLEGFYVYKDDEKVGALKSGTFFYNYVHEGKHVYYVKGEGKIDTVTINANKGEEYYIKGELHAGMFTGRPSLTMVYPSEGQQEIINLKYAVLKK